MSLSFLLNEMNADFLADLGTWWGVDFDKERYTLINPSIKAITKGKSVSAVLQFFIDLGGHYLQDEAKDESRTALNAYTELAQGTGYTFHLVDSFPAAVLNYQKNMSKTERFHYYNKRYGVEFIVSGTNVYLYRKIGSHRPEVRIDEDLNVKDATVEIDDANFFTWCKCYYDKVDDTEGGAEEYRHETVFQDEGLIEQYGEIEGPAIYQGSIKDEQVMLDFAKSTQEESLKVSHSVTLADLRRQGYEEFIFHAGDTIRLSLSSINTTVDIRIMEIDETFDVNGELTGLTLTLGNYDPVDAFKNDRNAVLLDLEDWIRGRKTIPSNMLENAIQQAADIVTGDTDSVMEYRKDRLIGHHDKNAGNNVQLNVSGLVYYRNGVPKTAITYEGITADAITAGSINANHVSLVGEGITSEGWGKYLLLQSDMMELRGTFKRTWQGVTETHDTYTRLKDGHLRFRNEDFDRSLYYSDFGISTFVDGDGNQSSSGTLQFFDYSYDSNARGVTLESNLGVVALRSRENRIVVEAQDTVNLESEDFSVYVRPFRESRPGTNEFQFYVKDNASGWDTDGALLFGSITEGAGAGSGIRFKKDGRDDPTVYITNSNGDIGTGDVHAKAVRSESIRVLDEGANLYLGTSTGEVRVTNNLLYNGGDIGYKPIKASAFNQASSRDYKSNVSELPDVGLETVMGLKVVSYHLKDDLEEGITDNEQVGLIAEDSAPVATNDLSGIDLYKMASYSLKAIQELSDRVEKLEGTA